MKILFHLILLFGAMTGLLGHSTAMAMAPVVSVSMSAMADMDGCADTVDGSKQGDMLCKKITWQCIAAMGCAPAAVALPTFATAAVTHTVRLPHARPVVAAMLGRSVAPELDPPAFLI